MRILITGRGGSGSSLTRAQAKQQGLKRYFTGKPCSHGHIAERQVCNCLCVACASINFKKWYQKEAEDQRQRAKSYRLENSESVKASVKAYKQKNAELIKSKRREHYLKTAEQQKEKARVFREQNPELARQRNRASKKLHRHKHTALQVLRDCAKLKATPSWADAKVIQEFYALAAAMSQASGCRYEVDHIVPLKSKLVCGFHSHDNLQILSSTDNRKKSNWWVV